MHRLRWAHAALGVAGLLGNLYPSSAWGQGEPTTLQEFREVHLGMEFRIVLDARDHEGAAAIARQAFDRVDSLDLVLSDWRPRSELIRVGELPSAAWHPISTDLAAVLSLALDVAARTTGRFDPTIGPLTQLWRQERSTGVSPSEATRAEARARVGWAKVDLDSVNHRIRFRMPGMRLDLGGVAKGWILDQVGLLLRSHGQSRFLVEAGGDLLLGEAPRGSPGWRIRMSGEHGDTTLTLQDTAISTSGPSAQALPMADGTRASHVIDVARGAGSAATLEVTVAGAKAAVTDAVATALTLVPTEGWQALLEHYDVRLLTVRR